MSGKWRDIEVKLRKFGKFSSNKHIKVQYFQYLKHFLKYKFSRGILETTAHWEIQYKVEKHKHINFDILKCKVCRAIHQNEFGVIESELSR